MRGPSRRARARASSCSRRIRSTTSRTRGAFATSTCAASRSTERLTSERLSWRFTMAKKIDWMIKGPWLTTCNCVVGCPCQFNALPSHGHCRAAVGCEIEQGHFGKVRLDGVRFAGLFAWPKAIHFGGGEVQPIVDVTATAQQREAILTILKGEQTEPGATIFNVFAGTFAKMHE